MREFEKNYSDDIADFIDLLLEDPINFKESRKGEPVFSFDELEYLIQQYVTTQSGRSALAELDETFDGCIIVGDLHGDIFSARKAVDPFLSEKYPAIVFLGDYVDRGDDSLLVLGYLIALAITYPSRIELLKGNHEEIELNKKYGFFKELKMIYPTSITEVEDLLDLLYGHLSIAAKTPNDTLCVHGGIPSKTPLADIDLIPKPHFKLIMEPDEQKRDRLLQAIFEITWNDPRTDQANEFEQSHRSKKAKLFNQDALHSYLDEAECRRLVRAHESSRGSLEILFDERLVHIFTAEPYFGRIERGTVAVDTSGSFQICDLEFSVIEEIK